MARVIEPLKQEKKLIAEFDETTKRVLLIFWHGLGDLVMFLQPYYYLKSLYPDIQIDLAVQKGLGFEEVVPEAMLITGDDMQKLEEMPYDIVAKIHFPMNEDQVVYTKGEFCCLHELGIRPVSGHMNCGSGKNRLVLVHFNITCLPDACNPSEETAKQIWQDIIDAGYIPLECHFEHAFHNPVNKKFDFVNATVRGCTPQISSLIGLMSVAHAFIGVVSGPFHTALATLPCSRIFFLEKYFKLECFTHLPVARASIMDEQYKGEVKTWLTTR